ncbi:NINE protein [Agromyces badenianii]|uniref:NINE protein n=1 Tax=Agromyces badenianii TaxID=2080742 RepID=UPI001F35B879|nr:TM2 domain-containing protein [Agromyces badenianii]
MSNAPESTSRKAKRQAKYEARNARIDEWQAQQLAKSNAWGERKRAESDAKLAELKKANAPLQLLTPDEAEARRQREIALVQLSLNPPGGTKNAGVGYFLLIVFGLLGAHRFYLKKWGTGLLWLLTLGLVGLGWIWDLFTYFWQIEKYNRDYHNRLLDEAEAARTASDATADAPATEPA